jgi:tRNA-specific 2-thiouridylase
MIQNRCIALYSGGLDSILAIKVIQEQGIDVIPILFYTPFFGFDAMKDPESFKKKHADKYGMNIHTIDYTDDIIQILSNPPHGFGKHLNPCIDCKIGMLKKSRHLLETLNASFIITGEVVGQRPMSQRRHTMKIIEKESGLSDILLRPLCARYLPEALPERLGLVKRDALWDLRGRGRKIQIAHALAYGIKEEDIPTPAGGCLLTDEHISIKVKQTFQRCSPSLPGIADIMLDIVGRKFVLDSTTMLVVSRNEEENKLLSTMRYSGNIFLKINEVPGPLCIVRGEVTRENLVLAAGICLRYGKGKGSTGHVGVYGEDPDHMDQSVEAPVFSLDYCRAFQD